MLYYLVSTYHHHNFCGDPEQDVQVITVVTGERRAIQKILDIYEHDDGTYTGYCFNLKVYFGEEGEKIDFTRTYKKTLGWVCDGRFIWNSVYKYVD